MDEESKPLYSGIYTITERTYDDVYFECPGATHFAITNRNPNLETGQALFGAICANEFYTYTMGSGNNGTALTSCSMHSTGTEASYHSGVQFIENGVRMFNTYGAENYRKWFQPGTYDWCAW